MSKQENHLTRRRFFFIWQENRQTQWLQTMASQGWHLEKIRLFHFKFVRGEPADMIYRLDFIRLYGQKWQEYLGLFADAGWEHVGSSKRFQFFRKPRRPGESSEIYTDAAGQIGKYKRTATILLAVLAMNIGNFMATVRPGPFRLIHVVYLLIFLLLSYSLWQVFAQIRHLRQDIRGKL